MPTTDAEEALSLFCDALASNDLDELDAATELLAETTSATAAPAFLPSLQNYLGAWPSLLASLRSTHESSGVRRYRFAGRMLEVLSPVLREKRLPIEPGYALLFAQMAEYEARRSCEDRWLWAVFRWFPADESTVRALVRVGFGPEGRGLSQRLLSHLSARTLASEDANVIAYLSRLNGIDALGSAVRTAKTYGDDVSALTRPITNITQKRRLSFDEVMAAKSYVESEVPVIELSEKHWSALERLLSETDNDAASLVERFQALSFARKGLAGEDIAASFTTAAIDWSEVKQTASSSTLKPWVVAMSELESGAASETSIEKYEALDAMVRHLEPLVIAADPLTNDPNPESTAWAFRRLLRLVSKSNAWVQLDPGQASSWRRCAELAQWCADDGDAPTEIAGALVDLFPEDDEALIYYLHIAGDNDGYLAEGSLVDRTRQTDKRFASKARHRLVLCLDFLLGAGFSHHLSDEERRAQNQSAVQALVTTHGVGVPDLEAARAMIVEQASTCAPSVEDWSLWLASVRRAQGG